jgi:hypothetical protein
LFYFYNIVIFVYKKGGRTPGETGATYKNHCQWYLFIGVLPFFYFFSFLGFYNSQVEKPDCHKKNLTVTRNT